MRRLHFLLFLCVSAHSTIGFGQTDGPVSRSPTRQLGGLSSDEAVVLINKVEEAQRRLKSGEFQSFELLAGSVASAEMTKVSPRDAFLRIPFNEVWKIDRVRTDNQLWQPYKLSYAPNGLGQLFWQIEVVLGASGELERVLMIYRPPAPF